MLPSTWRSVVQVMPTGLLSAMYTGAGRSAAAPTTAPSTRTSSPSPTWVPSSARRPLTVTRPASIHASASRREQMPLSLMYLLRRFTSGEQRAGDDLEHQDRLHALEDRQHQRVDHVAADRVLLGVSPAAVQELADLGGLDRHVAREQLGLG